jgi:hypothetical protein
MLYVCGVQTNNHVFNCGGEAFRRVFFAPCNLDARINVTVSLRIGFMPPGPQERMHHGSRNQSTFIAKDCTYSLYPRAINGRFMKASSPPRWTRDSTRPFGPMAESTI